MRFILLRGLGRDQLHWTPLLNEIKAVFPDSTIETPDLPGAGILHRKPSPTALADYIPLLSQQLSRSEEPAVIVGLSLGGMLALTWAALEPETFSHVVAINSSCNLTPFYKRLLAYKAINHPGAIFRPSIAAKERAVYRMTCNTRPVDETIIRRWVEIQLLHPVTITNQIKQIWAALKFSPPPRALLPELSIIYSEGDRLVNPDCSRDLIKFYNSDSYVHPWAGHDLPQDDPKWLAMQLKNIIYRQSGSTSISH
ncbi:alpha/beta fold hydrolase [Pleionea sediminis]|uniref:alpha/beta fold hydrolase n=1 Tax=Pleionea sediminis TaxID=2569479 RepID=UPI0011851F22|nr:alpha/beta hydrolase [Pleionea sediminis]